MPPRRPEFWSRRGAVRARLLAPAGALYGLAGALRQARARPWKAPVPVICIGNVVAGGSGKTPVAQALRSALAARGLAAHVISRGYGGRLRGPVLVDSKRHGVRDVGDEPLLLARDGPTWVARDRAAGARAASAAGADLIVLDDGFQNPALVKDRSLLVVDGGYGFGNGRVMPAGPLREPLAAALARAEAALIIGADRRHAAAAIVAARRDLPVLRARMVPDAAALALAGQRVVAFAGIGRPAKFFETLAEIGADVVAAYGFADHHPYKEQEILKLHELAVGLDARLATTEKDLRRLTAEMAALATPVAIRLEWAHADALDGLLSGVIDLGGEP